MARNIEASRPGRNAEPPPCRCLIAMSRSITPLRSISRRCISASMRSISCRIASSSLAGGAFTAQASCVHRVEEVRIGLGVAQLPEQELDRVDSAHRIENATQHVHLFEDV